MPNTRTLLEETRPLSLRERLQTSRLAEVQDAYVAKLDELQTGLRRGLSPAMIDQKQFELDALRDLQTNLRKGLETIARQNDAARADQFDQDLDEDERIGGFRTQRAYLDTLQRERAKVAPLSREQFESAKETSAKRSRKNRRGPRGVDIDPDTLFSQAHPTWWTQPNRVRSYKYAKETLTGIDPCVEAKIVRREVMFAQKSAGKGWHTRKQENPC